MLVVTLIVVVIVLSSVVVFVGVLVVLVLKVVVVIVVVEGRVSAGLGQEPVVAHVVGLVEARVTAETRRAHAAQHALSGRRAHVGAGVVQDAAGAARAGKSAVADVGGSVLSLSRVARGDRALAGGGGSVLSRVDRVDCVAGVVSVNNVSIGVGGRLTLALLLLLLQLSALKA